MPEISFGCSTEAAGIWAMEDKLWPAADSYLPFRFMRGHSHCHERHVPLTDGWRIQQIRLPLLRVDVS